MGVLWDGITRAESLSPEFVTARQALADAARKYDWPKVLEQLAGSRELVNVTRPGGASGFAPLHQAAHGGAPVEVVRQLLELGAWRTLQNSRGERPIDVAVRMKQAHLQELLEPVCRRRVPVGVLLKIQANFHAVIRERADALVREHALRLPELEPLLELDEPTTWFPVPGMYGGFKYTLEAAGVNARLVSESWCRVVGGSGQRHVITSAGSVLEAEGFV